MKKPRRHSSWRHRSALCVFGVTCFVPIKVESTSCPTFVTVPRRTVAVRPSQVAYASSGATPDESGPHPQGDKGSFLRSLDSWDSLNAAGGDRSALLDTLIKNRREVDQIMDDDSTVGKKDERKGSPSLRRPGSCEAFSVVAPGTWDVIYAPHMTFMAGLAGGEFQVQYVLHEDGTMESHARYDFPLFNLKGYLSVSGTYSSEDGKDVCRVDFDQAWVKVLTEENGDDDSPYSTIEDVPVSFAKQIITTVGRSFFFDQVSVFPVSFLDNDLIVFDFELLGTRICAKKRTS